MAQDPTKKQNSFSRGMAKDVADMYQGEGVWTHARNAINRTHQGDELILSVEPGNEFLVAAPYTVVGLIHRSDTVWVTFSTDEENSEIGLFDERLRTYQRVVASTELNFSAASLITGASKQEYDQTWAVYWRDGRNPDRVLNLSDVPYRTTGKNLSPDPDCFVAEYTTQLDVDQLLLHPKISLPGLIVTKNPGGGQLAAGSYQVVVAYSVKGIRVTDYFTPSNVVSLWHHDGAGGALRVVLTELDTTFEEYELVLISTTNSQAQAHRVGYYSIRQTQLVIDQVQQSQPIVDLALLTKRNVLYHISDGMSSLNGYLLRWGMHSKPEFNYQPLANKIKASWTSVRYPADYYYQSGINVSYLRDEVYAFFIRWVYNTGLKSASYHIPGRAATNTDMQLASGPDVLVNESKAWQVLDTSTSVALNESLPDGGVRSARGDFQFWQSEERYPDNQLLVWGDLCGKPIRHHKFPSNERSSHFTTGGEFIEVLGIEFTNITHPTDDAGQPLADVVGYEILRASREGNKSIVAKGLFNVMGEYNIPNSTTKGLYQNYPYNDLRPDKFLLDRDSVLKGSGNPDDNVSPLAKFKFDHFSFHSPETTFNKPFLSGSHVHLYSEVRGQVRGQYDYVFGHPKEKLITNFAFSQAVIAGLGIAVAAALGTGQMSTELSAAPLGIGGSVTYTRNGGIATAIPDAIANLISSPVTTGSGLGIMLLSGAYWAGQGIEQALGIIYNLSPSRQYALQYNSHGFYDSFSNVPDGQRRRGIETGAAQYIGGHVQGFSGTHRINNWSRQPFVALKTSTSLPAPSQVDNTRQRLQDVGLWQTPTREFTTNTSSYYGALKLVSTRQYGQLDALTQLPVHSGTLPSKPSEKANSGVLFGGDTYITRYTEKNPYFFFNTWLQKDVPDNYEYDYRLGLNGPPPRYWASFERFDLGDMDLNIRFGKGDSDDDDIDLGLVGIDVGKPSDLHSLDRNKSVDLNGIFSVNHAYFYLFCNGVRDFFVESELNLSFRDHGEAIGERFWNPYDHYADLPSLFRSDVIQRPELLRYDKSLSVSRLFQNFISWGSILGRDYDPLTAATRFAYFPDRAVYSLPHQSGLKRDNWKTYLANNYRDFTFRINQIKALNATGALILFENSEPVQFTGVDQLQTQGGVKLTIGDGGLFQQGLQSVVNADDSLERGSCQSRFAALNTEHGCFWVSQKTAKIFRYGGSSAQDITQLGMQRWFEQYLPSQLLHQFPTFALADNPVEGVGVSMVYDPNYELLYVSKRDFRVKQSLLADVRYHEALGFVYGEQPVVLGDERYFEDCSWTISFDPTAGERGQGAWISFHDWLPSWTLPSYQHFVSVANKSFYRHNVSTTSYAHYYGTDFPFEVELPLSTAPQVSVLKSVEYLLEGKRYTDQGQNALDVADAEFDEAYLYNPEQHSGLLQLVAQNKKNPVSDLGYPKLVGQQQQILVSKVESKHRFNQFWDQTKDRQNPVPAFAQQPNGYQLQLNPSYFDYQKPVTQRKRLRHYGNRLFLRKRLVGAVNYLLKLTSVRLGFSQR